MPWVNREIIPKPRSKSGSLPSSTDNWTVYREVAVNERFYIALEVVQASGANSKRGKLIADLKLISESNEVIAEIHSAKVTASANLNDLFLPKASEAKA